MVISTIDEIRRQKLLHDKIIEIINRNRLRYGEIAQYYGGPLGDNSMNSINSFRIDDSIDIDYNIIERGVNPQRDIMHKYMVKKAKKIRVFR